MLPRSPAARSSLLPDAVPTTETRQVMGRCLMCRITTRVSADELVLKLEGSLVGPWVRELDACWRDAAPKLGARRLRIDLSAVCHVDAEGRELMTLMYRAGAAFVARGCVMPEVVREITEAADPAQLSSERS